MLSSDARYTVRDALRARARARARAPWVIENDVSIPRNLLRP